MIRKVIPEKKIIRNTKNEKWLLVEDNGQPIQWSKVIAVEEYRKDNV